MQTRPPYALVPVEFRFRALALQSGHSPLGGARELLLALLLAARLTDGAIGRYALPAAVRRARAAAARGWLASLTLPASARQLLQRVIDATGADDPGALRAAWEATVTHVSPSLEPTSRAELRGLTAAAEPTP